MTASCKAIARARWFQRAITAVIMNSMSEMHREIEERDRARHETESGGATLEDEIQRVEQQIDQLKQSVRLLRKRRQGQNPPHT